MEPQDSRERAPVAVEAAMKDSHRRHPVVENGTKIYIINTFVNLNSKAPLDRLAFPAIKANGGHAERKECPDSLEHLDVMDNRVNKLVFIFIPGLILLGAKVGLGSRPVPSPEA
jgi:hypothetical protein